MKIELNVYTDLEGKNIKCTKAECVHDNNIELNWKLNKKYNILEARTEEYGENNYIEFTIVSYPLDSMMSYTDIDWNFSEALLRVTVHKKDGDTPYLYECDNSKLAIKKAEEIYKTYHRNHQSKYSNETTEMIKKIINEYNEPKESKKDDDMTYIDKTLFCICGETASGKDTLVKKLIEKFPNQCKTVCSYTTRPKRENETDGVEHYFVSQDEFDKLKVDHRNDIIGYTKISSDGNDGYEYLALLDELKNSNIYIIDPIGIKWLKNNFLDKIRNIVVIYIYAPLEHRLKRTRIRRDIPEDVTNRILNETNQFTKFRLGEGNNSYDYFIDNSINNETKSFGNLVNIINYEYNK